MKKIIVTVMAVFAMTFSLAQNVTDGLRISTTQNYGTARFQSMSGAFGALGGDLSAIGLNPAGSAIFIKNTGTVSLAAIDRNNRTTYFSSETNSIDTDASINQAGAVFIFNNANEESLWKKLSLGVNYDNTRNNEEQFFAQGVGNISIAEFFRSEAQGIPLELLQLQPGETLQELYQFLGENQGVSAQNALLGFQGFILDPENNDPLNTNYISNVAGTEFSQEYSAISEGYNGKFTFNAAAQYGENIFFGINLNSHTIEYTESTFFLESNSNTESLINRVGFQNNLSVLGAGFSAQIGAIVRVKEVLRLGATYDTPTWYRISEETTQNLETRRSVNDQNISEFLNPQVINVFEEYNFKTPGKIGLSAAYIFGAKGLLSFDYSYKNYAGITFGSNNQAAFSGLNIAIDNQLKSASTYKLGGEYRIHKLSLRGGYHFEESPYIDETTVSDLSGFSLGAGYNLGNYTLDVSYSRSEQDSNRQLYPVGLTSRAGTDTVFSNFVFTLGFSL